MNGDAPLVVVELEVERAVRAQASGFTRRGSASLAPAGMRAGIMPQAPSVQFRQVSRFGASTPTQPSPRYGKAFSGAALRPPYRG